jgi:hypothetical protein
MVITRAAAAFAEAGSELSAWLQAITPRLVVEALEPSDVPLEDADLFRVKEPG